MTWRRKATPDAWGIGVLTFGPWYHSPPTSRLDRHKAWSIGARTRSWNTNTSLEHSAWFPPESSTHFWGNEEVVSPQLAVAVSKATCSFSTTISTLMQHLETKLSFSEFRTLIEDDVLRATPLQALVLYFAGWKDTCKHITSGYHRLPLASCLLDFSISHLLAPMGQRTCIAG